MYKQPGTRASESHVMRLSVRAAAKPDVSAIRAAGLEVPDQLDLVYNYYSVEGLSADGDDGSWNNREPQAIAKAMTACHI